LGNGARLGCERALEPLRAPITQTVGLMYREVHQAGGERRVLSVAIQQRNIGREHPKDLCVAKTRLRRECCAVRFVGVSQQRAKRLGARGVARVAFWARG
jgi:hypothetical protein